MLFILTHQRRMTNYLADAAYIIKQYLKVISDLWHLITLSGASPQASAVGVQAAGPLGKHEKTAQPVPPEQLEYSI